MLPSLKKSLLRELELGNEIVEASQELPKEGAMIIILKKPFVENY